MMGHIPGSGDDVVEKHWGDPNRSQPREVFGRGEVATAMVWLSVAALASLLIEIAYLGTWVELGAFAVPQPWTIPAAYVVNLILTRTALLWTENRTLAAVPLGAWTIGFGLVLLWAALPAGGDQLLGNGLRTIGLLAAGIIGGGWPLRHPK